MQRALPGERKGCAHVRGRQGGGARSKLDSGGAGCHGGGGSGGGASAPLRRLRGQPLGEDGRSIGVDDAVHLSPVEPTKIICCHLKILRIMFKAVKYYFQILHFIMKMEKKVLVSQEIL
jgi:hypothetical protein